ncbi:hypothetical protein [Leifsonia sp. NPDC058230]|uniref:hypothetical protein n=1 Tax=Leifsonia sp. NPDC058230 TaxID=3346391 RepID=UPI0036D76DED
MSKPELVLKPRPKETTMMTNALEAKAEVASLYRGMQELLGGDWIDDTHNWGPCYMLDGSEGVSYSMFSIRRSQPLPAPPKRIAEQAQAIWARFGHRVEIEYNDVMRPPRHVLSEPRLLAGSKPDGLLIQFTVGEDYADFTANSRCVLGDQEKLNLLEVDANPGIEATPVPGAARRRAE